MKKMKRMILLLLLLFCTIAACETETDISVKLSVPDTTWTIAIDEVHKVGNELWVISRVWQKPGMMGAQMISTVAASIKITAPDLPVKNFIIGKTWNWENSETYTFIKNLNEIEKELETGKLLYKA